MARLNIPDEPTFATFTATAQTVFPISFALFVKANLRVSVDGIERAQNTFTFSGTLLDGGGYQGGTVTLNVAATGAVRIWRDITIERATQFAPSASVPVGSVDQALNRLTAQQQDVRLHVDTRTGELEAELEDAKENFVGPEGPEGPAGPSAYDEAVLNGFIGTAAEWLESLVGPVGPQGVQGIQGEQGSQGVQGPAGSGTGDMLAANNLSEVDPATARTNLGLGDAATKDIDVAFGVASLGADSKISTSLLPDAVLGALKWQSVWNATTNSPTIPSAAAGNKGWYYKVSVAGTTSISGITDWEIGDWVVSNGTTWDKIDNTDQVMSVAGLKGIITDGDLKTALAIAIGDVSGLQTALDAKADLADSFVTVSTTTYTLLLANLGKVHRFTHASGCTVTLPNSFPAGWNFLWRQCAAGAVTFNAQAGGTRVNRSSHTKSAGLNAEGSLAVDTNTGANAAWWLSGDTAA